MINSRKIIPVKYIIADIITNEIIALIGLKKKKIIPIKGNNKTPPISCSNVFSFFSISITVPPQFS